MDILDNANLFTDPDSLSESEREIKDRLWESYSQAFADAYRIMKGVMKGKTGAFCVLEGKANGKLVPWPIIAKTPSQAMKQLKLARQIAKQVAGVRGATDLFKRGTRFARGTVRFDEETRRLVVQLEEGSLDKDRVARMFRKPNPALKKAGQEVKRLLAFLADATFTDADGSSRAPEAPHPEVADLGIDRAAVLAEFAAEDGEDLSGFLDEATDWHTAMDEADNKAEAALLRAASLDEALESFKAAPSAEEKVNAWATFVSVAETRTDTLVAGAQLGLTDWAFSAFAALAEANRYFNELQAETARVHQLEQAQDSAGETASPDAMYAVEDHRRRVIRLREAFEALVEDLPTL